MRSMALLGMVQPMKKLRGTDGSRWTLLKTAFIPETATAETALLKRWRIIQTPLFAVFVHCHFRPDPSRDLHDHPYNFCTWILKGDYSERRNGKRPLVWRTRSWHFMPAERPHSIHALSRIPTWTLLLVGRRRRDWGFYTSDGWIPHKEYDLLNETEPGTEVHP
jgi:hypothetical protein